MIPATLTAGRDLICAKVFAEILDVPCRTVEGKSTPTPAAKKLMFLIQEDHSLVQKTLAKNPVKAKPD